MRAILKQLADLVATALVLPLVGMYGLAALVAGRDAAFPGWSQAMSLLPGMSGVALARRIQELRPSVRILFMSGYTADVIVHHGIVDEGTVAWDDDYLYLGAEVVDNVNDVDDPAPADHRWYYKDSICWFIEAPRDDAPEQSARPLVLHGGTATLCDMKQPRPHAWLAVLLAIFVPSLPLRAAENQEDPFARQRDRMVERDIAGRGVEHEATLKALRSES